VGGGGGALGGALGGGALGGLIKFNVGGALFVFDRSYKLCDTGIVG